MKINNAFKFIIAVVVCEFAGIIGALFTAPAIESGWYDGLAKPALNPPNWVFGHVWTILYFLMAISLYLAWKNNWEVKNQLLQGNRKAWNFLSERLWTGDLNKKNAIAIFSFQLFLNIL